MNSDLRAGIGPLRRIAIEEAFSTAALYSALRRMLDAGDVDPALARMGASVFGPSEGAQMLKRSLLDLDAGRIEHMDAAGIDVQVLSITSPGVQPFGADEAVGLARDANDQLFDAVGRHPGRLYGLTTVAPQNPAEAAREIERGKTKLGMRGLLINSHTHGAYLDDPRFFEMLEAAEALDQPLYLHPREPGPAMAEPYLDYGLYFAGWGFAAETGLHAMRIIMSGLLDRLPRLKIILGHLGEGLPFWLERIDNRYELQLRIGAVKPLKRRPSEYFRDNFVITTSGMHFKGPFNLCLDTLGSERILFAADHPYESSQEAAAFFDAAELSAADKANILHANAEALFNLPTKA